MKEGYIVMNQTNYGDGFEIFGVYKNIKTAERQLRKVIRNRYGKCPRDIDKIDEMLYKKDYNDESYKVVYFNENEG